MAGGGQDRLSAEQIDLGVRGDAIASLVSVEADLTGDTAGIPCGAEGGRVTRSASASDSIQVDGLARRALCEQLRGDQT